MLAPVLIAATACLAMILGILFLPKLGRGRFSVDTYWVAAAAGAIALCVLGYADLPEVWSALADFSLPINPIKILSLFLSMTILSVYLDELGFFRYLASAALRRAGASQKRLFLVLYLTVSVLTVFTSNDVIILSFTPFVCYFAKSARINPIPYLAAEFVAANTWSMALVIGNPTNIYLATANGIGFGPYFRTMIIPTLGAGAAAFAFLLLAYRRSLSAPLSGVPEEVRIADPLRLWIGIAHLAVCTVTLAASGWLGWEMWRISCVAVVSLFFADDVVRLVRRGSPSIVFPCLRRAPWQLIPFVISMFVTIIVLGQCGVTRAVASALGSSWVVARYGAASFLSANLINNIPMSVLFCSLAEHVASPETRMAAVYAAIAGSNLGALLSPIGALAGIMWSSILVRHGLKFGYLDFLRLGLRVGVPAFIVCLVLLNLAT